MFYIKTFPITSCLFIHFQLLIFPKISQISILQLFKHFISQNVAIQSGQGRIIHVIYWLITIYNQGQMEHQLVLHHKDPNHLLLQPKNSQQKLPGKMPQIIQVRPFKFIFIYIYDSRNSMLSKKPIKYIFIDILFFQEYPFSQAFLLLILKTIGKYMNLDQNVLSRTTKTEKLFNFQRGHCTYQNIESFSKKKENDQDHQVKIFNTICKDDGKKLVKLTEIQFRDKIITIEDQYFFHVEPNIEIFSNDRSTTANTGSSEGSTNTNNVSNPSGNIFPKKKKLIFKKKLVGSQKSTYQLEKRNTKNIAKNFCRAFMAYLQDKKQKATFIKTKELISAYKFNNRTIERIATDQNINRHFKQFLETKAQEWINTSKINDKDIHKQAIELYLQLIEKAVDRIEDSEELYAEDMKSNYHSDQVYDESNSQNEMYESSQH